MADTKQYIKTVQMPINGVNETLHIKDSEAVDTINGYTTENFKSTSTGTEPAVTFANKRIEDSELKSLFGI